MTPYKAKSLSGAEKKVRHLQTHIVNLNAKICRFDYERKMLAKLAAEIPQFFNPFDAWEAKKIRDQILQNE